MATNNAINLKYTAGNNKTYTFPNKNGTVALLDDLRTPSSTKTANYTLVLWDAQSLIYMNSSSALTLTVPTNTSVAFPIDTQIDIRRNGTGDVTISPASGVTIDNPKRKLYEQYVAVTLKKSGTDTWTLTGNLKA